MTTQEKIAGWMAVVAAFTAICGAVFASIPILGAALCFGIASFILFYT